MVSTEMEYKTEQVEVGTEVFRSVEYAWQTDGNSTTFFLKYEGDDIDPMKIRLVVVQNENQALDLVRMWAGNLYRQEEQAPD